MTVENLILEWLLLLQIALFKLVEELEEENDSCLINQRSVNGFIVAKRKVSEEVKCDKSKMCR